MNYSTAVFLINDDVRAIACTYEAADNAPRTVFKSFDKTILRRDRQGRRRCRRCGFMPSNKHLDQGGNPWITAVDRESIIIDMARELQSVPDEWLDEKRDLAGYFFLTGLEIWPRPVVREFYLAAMQREVLRRSLAGMKEKAA